MSFLNASLVAIECYWVLNRNGMFKMKFYGILLAVVFVGGCGGVKTQAMQHGAANPVQTIALLAIGTNDSFEYQEPGKRETTIMGFNTGTIDRIKETVDGTILGNTRIQVHLRSSNYGIANL